MTIPRLIPDKLTPCSPAEVYAALERAWVAKFDAAPRRESLLTLLAQFAEEDGLGRAVHCWNLGNAKTVAGGPHAWTYFECGETINGHDRRYYPDDPACCFRAFDTLDDGAGDYLDMMAGRFRKAWPAVIAGDPASFAHLLKISGYYTAPEDKYSAALTSLYRQLDKLIPGGEVEPAQGWSWKAVQTALNVRMQAVTMHLLVVDGDPGPKTRAALAWLQRTDGLPQTGRADDATVQALRPEANA